MSSPEHHLLHNVSSHTDEQHDNGGGFDRDPERGDISPRSWNPFRSNPTYEYQPAGLGLDGSTLDRAELPADQSSGRDTGQGHPHSRVVSFDTENGDSHTPKTTLSYDVSSPELSGTPWLLNDSSKATLLDQSVKCPTKSPILQRRLSWASLTILVLAIYCTAMSGLFVVIALCSPRYHNRIGANNGLAPSQASVISAIIAKTIELSYVTVFVAFLGQVLSRKAISRRSRGVSLSDMNMRMWIVQPGSLVVHWETLLYSGWSILGVLTLMATVVAMLYTTAANELGE